MPDIKTCPFVWKEGVPYPKEAEMLPPEGMKHILAQDGRTDIMPFLLDVAITEYKGSLYLAWYNSTDAEIYGASLIRGIRSEDGGETWSEPFTIAGGFEAEGRHFVPASFFPHGGRLYALITEMSGKNITTDLDLFLRREGDDEIWDKVARVSEGFITNSAPQRMANGNWIVGGWTPMKNETPAFPVVLISEGDDIEKPWSIHFLYDPLEPGTIKIRCSEISLHVENETVTAYVRNDEGPSYVFSSGDYGLTWSEPMFNPMNVNNSKIYAYTLSNGKKVLCYNEDRGYFVRTMLVLAVAEPGERAFGKVYKILEGFEGSIGRGNTWWYPCLREHDGDLYIACSQRDDDNTRSAVISKIPIASL